MKYFLSIWFLLSTVITSAQVYIKLNVNDCFSSLKYIESLIGHDNSYLLLLDKRTILEQNPFSFELNDDKIIENHKLFKQSKLMMSSVMFTEEDKLIFEFPLVSFEDFEFLFLENKKINNFPYVNSYFIYSSENFTYKIDSRNIFCQDNEGGSIVKFSLNDDNIKRIASSFFEDIDGRYDNDKKELQKLGFNSNASIIAPFVKNDTVSFILKYDFVTDTIFEGSPEKVINSNVTFCQVFKDQLLSFYDIIAVKEVPKFVKKKKKLDKMYFHPSFIFKHGDKYYAHSRSHGNFPLDGPFVAEYEIQNDKLVPLRHLSYTFPIAHQCSQFTHYTECIYRDGFFMNRISKELYNLYNNGYKILKLSAKDNCFTKERVSMLDIRPNFVNVDFFIRNGIMFHLSSENENYYLTIYDLIKDKELYKKAIYTDSQVLETKNMPMFTHFGQIIIPDNEHINFVSIYEMLFKGDISKKE